MLLAMEEDPHNSLRTVSHYQDISEQLHIKFEIGNEAYLYNTDDATVSLTGQEIDQISSTGLRRMDERTSHTVSSENKCLNSDCGK